MNSIAFIRPFKPEEGAEEEKEYNMADIEDDEAPPALVDVSEQPISSTPTTTLDTPEQNRVPITLVTGMYHGIEWIKMY